MKVIDLLNKIANGEKVPKEIQVKFKGYVYHDTYKFNKLENWYVTLDESTLMTINRTSYLDSEIEIIEENKPIEKLFDNSANYNFSKTQNGMTKEDRRLLDSNFIELGNKINEIIDKVNELEMRNE